MSPGPQEPWPQATRAEALAIAADAGFVAASAQLGIPAATIRSWATRAKKAAGVELVEVLDSMPWGQRRDLLVKEYGQRAQQAAQKAGEALDKGKTSDARNCAIVSGIYTDKFLLLGGQATTRSETYSLSAQAGDEKPYRAKLDDQITGLLNEMEQNATVEQQRRLAELDREARRWEVELRALGGGDDDGGQAPEDEAPRGAGADQADEETP